MYPVKCWLGWTSHSGDRDDPRSPALMFVGMLIGVQHTLTFSKIVWKEFKQFKHRCLGGHDWVATRHWLPLSGEWSAIRRYLPWLAKRLIICKWEIAGLPVWFAGGCEQVVQGVFFHPFFKTPAPLAAQFCLCPEDWNADALHSGGCINPSMI